MRIVLPGDPPLVSKGGSWVEILPWSLRYVADVRATRTREKVGRPDKSHAGRRKRAPVRSVPLRAGGMPEFGGRGLALLRRAGMRASATFLPSAGGRGRSWPRRTARGANSALERPALHGRMRSRIAGSSFVRPSWTPALRSRGEHGRRQRTEQARPLLG